MEYSLILHAHLPYVRPTGAEILEERWLYEAVAETYLPLLWGLERLQQDGVPARLAISFSGPLLSMLSDGGLMERCRDHLVRTAKLAAREALRYKGTDLEPAATFHAERYAALVTDLDIRRGDLPGAFGVLADAGVAELFTAAGSHGYLPLLATDSGRAAQIEAGLQEFERIFRRRPAGLWLPECAYAPGLDHLLSAAGVRWFVAEASTVEAAWPRVPTPCVRTPGGVAAFARDRTACSQVWDSMAGYPGDSVYREFYRDQGYDLPMETVAPWLVEGRVRSDTGLKYYSITGKVQLDQKRPYNPEWAANRAKEHARHYARRLAERQGLVVTPFDAELFGHWWFEGPVFLENLFREIAVLDGAVRPVTPSDYLEIAPEPPLVRLPAGSWGVDGNHTIWLAPGNDFLWPRLHECEKTMLELAAEGATPARVMSAAARELLLAQASDWGFIIAGGTSVEYARRRALKHLERFEGIAAGYLSPDSLDDDHLCFPALNGRALYAPPPRPAAREGAPQRILMLSWEFPPGNVGGLGRHVMDLGEALADLGNTVHVVTLADDMTGPGTYRTAGMVVHRVVRPPETGNFVSWVYRFNLSMVAAAQRAATVYGAFDMVHCHDWLAGQAGMALQARWRIPLIATIHATERGRCSVIREPMQEAIHAEEYQLTTAANAVIAVSAALAAEIRASFRVEPTVIYNGVKPPPEAGPSPTTLGAPYFVYIGRLVVEKGAQVAMRALAHVPGVHLVVAGKGPIEADLHTLSREVGVADRVHFVGRVSDTDKNAWLQNAAGGLVPSLYEPFGITALEVMSAGAPVIVGNTGGLAEIVTDGVDGLKVPPGDVDALAGAMAGLLTDPDLSRRLGAAGRRTAAERFSWPAIAPQTLEVYSATRMSRVHV